MKQILKVVVNPLKIFVIDPKWIADSVKGLHVRLHMFSFPRNSLKKVNVTKYS